MTTIQEKNALAAGPPASRTERSDRQVLLALGWYYPEIHRGVARYASHHGWHITADFDDPVPKNFRGHGVLTLLGARDTHWRTLKSYNVPVVDLTESREEIPLPRVATDNRAIGTLAGEYFLERGFRHFAFVCRWGMGVDRRRYAAFSDAVAQAGNAAQRFVWVEQRGKTADTRAARDKWLQQILRRLTYPCAVLATRDDVAAELLDACLALGLQVPEQVAILGVDNTEHLCNCLRVPLSSIDPDMEQVGYEGAALLDRLMDGAPAPQGGVIYIPPRRLVERRSTQMLATDHAGVLAALQFIEQESHRAIGVTDVAKAVAMSRSGLEKAFRQHFVRQVGTHLRWVRLERAKQLLAQTDEKIVAIAKAAGFVTAQNLCRIFQQQLHTSPKQFREKTRAV